VWDVEEAIERVKQLAEYEPWFIEEPTSPDDIFGHARIRQELKPYKVAVATGEHCQNRVIWKQLFQADAIDIAQVDACRLGGLNEVLLVLLMAKKLLPHL
jgi:L-galactonate dehydratase